MSTKQHKSGLETVASKSVTVRDVANQVGMSLATVSRALNGSSSVTPETAQLVRDAAKALGYRLNWVGRNLRSTRTHTIGVLLPTLLHPVFAECLQALQEKASVAQHGISLATTDYNPGNEERASETLLAQRVDGLILTVADARRSKLLDKLDNEGTPYVLVYNQTSGKSIHRPCVSVDNRKAAAHMAEHLLALGHRRIQMICGPFNQSDRAQQRHKGYADAMQAAGLPVEPPIELDFMTHDIRPVLQDVLATRARPSVLMCSSDQLAIRTVHALQGFGLRVPQDISVAGFDGIQLGQWMLPSLTTVVQPTADIAAVAFDLLQRLIAGEQHRGSAVLHHTLRLGGSVATRAESANS